MKELTKALDELKIEYSPIMIEQFSKYMYGILEKNKSINLTAITDEDEFVRKHYTDSVVCASMKEFTSAKRIADLGTGAGFPGVPLAILCPEKEFILIDSLQKRLRIVNELCEECGIYNVRTLHGRAEDVAAMKEYRESFDVCVTRAVANMTVLSEYCLPLIKKNGVMLAYKGPDADREISEAGKAIRILGGEEPVTRIMKITGFDMDHRIIVVNKVNKTPAKFPRKAGTPAKDPIK